MSNHHKSVIVLADAALEANNRSEMEDVIRHLEERHGHELDAMTSILRKTYRDHFIRHLMPNKADRRPAAPVRIGLQADLSPRCD